MLLKRSLFVLKATVRVPSFLASFQNVPSNLVSNPSIAPPIKQNFVSSFKCLHCSAVHGNDASNSNYDYTSRDRYISIEANLTPKEEGDNFGTNKYDRVRSGKYVSREFMVYISNLPENCSWHSVKDLIREKVGFNGHVLMHERESGDVATVALQDPDMINLAIRRMAGCELLGNVLTVVDKAGAQEMEQFAFLVKKRLVADGETFGFSVQFLETLKIQEQLSCKLFVKNVFFKVKEEELADAFALAGVVKGVKLFKTLDRNTGRALVEFEHPFQAVQAISMLQSQHFFGRNLVLKMDSHDIDMPSYDFDESVPHNVTGPLPIGVYRLGKGLGPNGRVITDLNDISSEHLEKKAEVETQNASEEIEKGAV